MLTNELINLIIKILGTSLPGYFSYVALYRLNIINVKKNRPEENKAILGLLSLLNCFLGLLILENSPQGSLFSNVLVISLGLFLFSTVILPFILPYLKFCYFKWLNLARKKAGFGEINSISIYKDVFDHSKGTRISIFDFSGNHIISGNVDSIVEDNQFDYFDMKLGNSVELYENFTPNQAIEMFQNAEKKDAGTYKVYIDFEKKLIFHIFEEKKKC
ncbi:hypothetical protein NOQ67_002700 [Enterococcus faecalis]|uniref:hypothetical protein n=1 Tax=Enterococcus faecalis TaxID=1351 RepID=UPI0013D504D4|nr:hypothetical protein [Enterococcus faecalis]EJM6036385.1 hypothetical protein [Enterococcus faecalis]NFA63732.1 hypothetical protein [Enterococcus faecalis]HAP3019609.1 hypothetical protein [Enterococcus faecalis]